MLNPLKYLRYLVFVVFIICNAIITSVAVWNLSIIEFIAEGVVAKEIGSYLIFLGALGLVVIFTVLFVDFYGKDVFVTRVWFELLWVGLYLIMELAGAVAITTQSNSQTCGSTSQSSNVFSQVSPCASTQVLQAFTWICAILNICGYVTVLGYFTLLFVSAVVKYKDDHTIWRCNMRNFPWLNTYQAHQSILASNKTSLPRFRTQVPVIVAPRPQRIITIPDIILPYRSGLGLDYEIEHYQPPALDPSVDEPISSLSPVAVSPTRTLLHSQRIPPIPGSVVSTLFYPAHVQRAIDPDPRQPSIAHLSQVRRPPPSPSPPPLGDWPRLDATLQPIRVKRKPNSPAPIPYSFTMPAAVQQRQPLSTTPRTRPSGPRRRSNSVGTDMPPLHYN